MTQRAEPIKFISPFEYKGHSLYATRVESHMTTPRWQGYIDNRPLHEWVATGSETEDEIRVILRTEAEAELQIQSGK